MYMTQRLSPSWARSGDGRLWILVGRTAGMERRTGRKEFTPHFLDFESRVGFVKKVGGRGGGAEVEGLFEFAFSTVV